MCRDARSVVRLKHEGEGVRGQALRTACVCCDALFVAERVWAVRAHASVQTSTPRSESVLAPLLRIVHASDEAHELVHVVAVIVGRAERVLGHGPARREDYKVSHRGARHWGGAREHGEDAGVRVVKAHGVHGAEAIQVVPVRDVVPVPGHDVERGEGLLRLKQLPFKFVQNGEEIRVPLRVLVPRQRALEVSRVCQPVGSDGPEVRQPEAARVHLQQVPAGGAIWQVHAEPNSSGNNRDAADGHLQQPHLRGEMEGALLRHNEVAAVRVGQTASVHPNVGAVHVNCKPVLGAGAPGAAEGHDARNKVHLLPRRWQI
mmetsp:Transcript_926/g.1896  ORF Transcript_926/g.1896 Transcript_926/m.1896 type:complete len:317 (+) Transcript_926:306-1256(+)